MAPRKMTENERKIAARLHLFIRPSDVEQMLHWAYTIAGGQSRCAHVSSSQ